MVADSQITEALRGVMHPEHAQCNLVDLGMIGDVAAERDTVTLTLNLPFKQTPIKEELIRAVKEAVDAVADGIEVEVKLVEMSQHERVAFATKVAGGPKPAQAENNIGQVIAVLSGKGGVGKSSIAALLAVELARKGERVGVLDADITGPSQPTLFGLHDSPQGGPLGMLPPETESGIKLMSINLLLARADEAVIWRGPLISSAIRQFWQEVAWGELDYLVVDLPPGTSDASLTVMQAMPLDGVVLVTSPQDLAGMVVRKAARMTRAMKVPILGLVENMSYAICPGCGERIEVFGVSRSEEMAKQLDVPLLGQLPLDPELSHRCDAGEIEQYQSASFHQVGEKLQAAVSTGEGRRSLD